MNKAVFLDRDGVINKEIGYVFRTQDFQLTDTIIPALKRLQEAGYLFIVVTNQSGIAKELYTHEDVKKVHAYMLALLNSEGIRISEIYYCCHHPDVEPCLCRKPDSGMIEKGLARFKIDPALSYMIGDKERDILAGQKAGLRTFHIESDAPLMGIVDEILSGGK